jgi:hypothetical protein
MVDMVLTREPRSLSFSTFYAYFYTTTIQQPIEATDAWLRKEFVPYFAKQTYRDEELRLTMMCDVMSYPMRACEVTPDELRRLVHRDRLGFRRKEKNLARFVLARGTGGTIFF